MAYDSRLGSTAEVAEFIGRVLSDNGTNVAVRRLEEVDDLTSYDRIVIGSAIRYDRWLPDAVAFVRANRQVLGTKSVAFFFTCLTLAKPTPDAIRTADGYAERLRSIAPDVDPVSVGRFAGVLDFARTPWPTRWLLRLLSLSTGVAEGDYRDWDTIRDWATNALAPE